MSYKEDEEGAFKKRQRIILSIGELDSSADNCTKFKRLTEEKNCGVTENFKKASKSKKILHVRKRNVKVKTLITVELCNIINLVIKGNYKAMVEAMIE